MQTDLEKNPRGATGNAVGSSAVVQASSTSFVILAAIFAAVGGLLFGYDTAAISGAVIFIKQQFSLSTFPEELVVGMVSWALRWLRSWRQTLGSPGPADHADTDLCHFYSRRAYLRVRRFVSNAARRPHHRRSGYWPGIDDRAGVHLGSLATKGTRLASVAIPARDHDRNPCRIHR
jgi:hypothetical protein